MSSLHPRAVCALLAIPLLLVPGQLASAADPTPARMASVRFLGQSSWGPSSEALTRLESIGINAFIEEQFTAPISPLTDVDLTITNLTPVQQEFFVNAVQGSDQLRQRVAFALSQIWVISGLKINIAEAYVTYLRVLQQNAFGNYYDLMRAVTLNPGMGHYLDMVNNDKPDPRTGRGANENYAREVLQLFTTGLYVLNADGSTRLDGTGQPMLAYTQDDIEDLARVFTGWTYAPAPGVAPRTHNAAYWTAPMVPTESLHDVGAKTILGGHFMPPGRTATEDLDDALRTIFQHPSVGPFISKQLIQHLVTSNPSPAYVARVAGAFANNGAGVRGDMKAVVRAILLDGEARRGDTPSLVQADEGHLREPVLFITGLLRPLHGTVTAGNSLANYSRNLGQNLYYAPSVFNYFSPTYQPSGSQLVAPEFEITSPAIAVQRINLVNTLIFGSLGTGTTIDWTAWTSLAADPNGLLDAVNAFIMHGGMDAVTRQKILTAVNAATTAKAKAQTALYLAATSAEYQVAH